MQARVSSQRCVQGMKYSACAAGFVGVAQAEAQDRLGEAVPAGSAVCSCFVCLGGVLGRQGSLHRIWKARGPPGVPGPMHRACCEVLCTILRACLLASPRDDRQCLRTFAAVALASTLAVRLLTSPRGALRHRKDRPGVEMLRFSAGARHMGPGGQHPAPSTPDAGHKHCNAQHATHLRLLPCCNRLELAFSDAALTSFTIVTSFSDWFAARQPNDHPSDTWRSCGLVKLQSSEAPTWGGGVGSGGVGFGELHSSTPSAPRTHVTSQPRSCERGEDVSWCLIPTAMPCEGNRRRGRRRSAGRAAPVTCDFAQPQPIRPQGCFSPLFVVCMAYSASP
eukprot:361556-Chlamydomonas_euryale.AAC.4